MLKITPFEINYQKLKDALKQKEHKKFVENCQKAMLSPNSYNPSATLMSSGSTPNFESYWQYSFGRKSNSDIEQETTEVKEVWVNPANIKKILRCSNEALGKNFLKIIMDDGEEFKVEGNSIQEFMMKNIILGNEA